MKNNLKKAAGLMLFLVGMAVFATGCMEHRYYREHHYHTAGYYHRHHMPPPPGVEIDIHH